MMMRRETKIDCTWSLISEHHPGMPSIVMGPFSLEEESRTISVSRGDERLAQTTMTLKKEKETQGPRT